MSSDDAKVVQTELPPEEYERLRQVASQEGKSLKAVLREASREYSDRHLAYDPDDPLFTVEPLDGGPGVDAADADELLAESIRADLEDDDG